MIKAIGFDWGGVLVSSKPIMPGISALLGMDKEDLYKFYLQHNYKAGVGDMSYKDLWAFVVTELGHGDKIQAVWDHMDEQQTFELDNRMIDLVDELRELGYKVGLLSNNTKQNGQLMRDVGLDKHFESFLISAEIGMQKPNPDAFLMLAKELNVEPSEMVFIDDSRPSVSSAEDVGFTPILFQGYEACRQELVMLGVITK